MGEDSKMNKRIPRKAGQPAKSDKHRREMNNEPVAWMELYYGEPNNIAWTNNELKDSGEVYKTIPLYTHPTKTLTDEEIMVLYEEYIETQYASESNVLGFGRAILRKAQEK
jgi:hypothetical protein